MNLYKNEINRKGSASWLLCNDNSKSEYFRNKFIKENGGFFVKKQYWEWNENIIKIEKSEPPNPPDAVIETVKKWIFSDKDGNNHEITNLTEFANKNNLSRQKLYDLIKGSRKTHKGFSFVSKSE